MSSNTPNPIHAKQAKPVFVKSRNLSAAVKLVQITRLRSKAAQAAARVREKRLIETSGDEVNRQHWSFTRQLAFGDASVWDKSTTRKKAIKKILCNRCVMRMSIVLVVFLLASIVFFLRMKERELDQRLRHDWLLKERRKLFNLFLNRTR